MKKSKKENTEYLNSTEFKFEPDVYKGHNWRQQGPFLVCTSCGLDHSIYIGMDKMMVGVNKDGTPKLEKR